MNSDIVQSYYKNPLKNYEMVDATVSAHQGNSLCGDDITVFLQVDDGVIQDYSFIGNCSMITTAAASFLSEIIIGISVDEVLTRNYETMSSQGFEVSPRRKRAAVIAILAVRNALHQLIGDGKVDDFDDLIAE
ncbi:MAG TPA: iron-sulfur cluster assembly scaffold protein [Candidatus Absconditabacterales bacterium]|nr:iron-sulfur cluster assembly scaffold protein [Candidatus Absconditabacterales bacterium]HMT27615.1 iron-sulfur cluster assembly scaffold protein [Candidatus Absconditabacterales bacterium]